MFRKFAVAALTLALGSTAFVARADSIHFGDWTQAVDIEKFRPGADPEFNTLSLEGCPFISRDGRSFFIASDRPGGLGGLDIWRSTRAHISDSWGPLVNLGAPVNSASNDFCPTLAPDGREFFFVSNRAGFCGTAVNSDIYAARFQRDGTVERLRHLGCTVNSDWDELSPFPIVEVGNGSLLYFSSARPANPSDLPGDHDLYQSPRSGDTFGGAIQVTGINTPDFHEGQPNVRRDGLEVFFYSNRTGTLGGNDIYSAVRKLTIDGWSTPVNLGPLVNGTSSETRPSLTWDGSTLYFGSTRAGSSDIYVSTR